MLGIVAFLTWKGKGPISWGGGYRYVLTNVEEPHSFDPLDADHTNNISTARMIYLTPLEVSDNDKLSSHILASFQYDEAANDATWIVKDGLLYSDNSPVTTEDVAFAVARMAYTRPGFPVIKYIKGLQEWIKSENPLQSYPEGIKVDGNKIEIEFNQAMSEPFYRFCLEIFSIIPKRCVDLKTNKIICDKIPTNGQYSIAHKGALLHKSGLELRRPHRKGKILLSSGNGHSPRHSETSHTIQHHRLYLCFRHLGGHLPRQQRRP